VEALNEDYVKPFVSNKPQYFVEVFEFPFSLFYDVDFMRGDADNDFGACLGITPSVGSLPVDGKVFVVNVFDCAYAVAFS
jgi:hypothetical protein